MNYYKQIVKAGLANELVIESDVLGPPKKRIITTHCSNVTCATGYAKHKKHGLVVSLGEISIKTCPKCKSSNFLSYTSRLVAL